MQAFKKLGIAMLISLLMACGNSEPQSTTESDDSVSVATQEKTSNTTGYNAHNIQNMQKVMGDARGVEALLQQSQNKRQEEMNKY